MNRGRFRNNRNNNNRNDKSAETIDSNNENNPIINKFRMYATELNEKHDRYERIVKQSRDITIESKRLIYLLHTVDLRKSNADTILADAFTRLTNLCAVNFCNIAKELDTWDQYQFARAYSAGLQEFVEAFTYYDYLKSDRMMNWNDLQKRLTYKKNEQNDDSNADELKIACLVQPIEFMLGLADLSGEIMRKCINSLGIGDIDTCHRACNFVQNLYSG